MISDESRWAWKSRTARTAGSTVTENGCDPGSPDPGSPSTNEPHVSMLSESEPSADPALK